MGGEIAGLSVSDGRVVVAGTTHNSDLASGATVNTAHAGGKDVFVLSLDPSLTADGNDRITFFGGAGDDTAADMQVRDGKVWLTGVHDRPLGGLEDDPTEAYAARLDAQTGAVEWSRVWQGAGNQAAPATLAVAAGGAACWTGLACRPV
ncbi:hypothetical protein [Brevundimonas abyssalis]|uniref:hypothetical protein n=1 Tax=Brevundimonas abyssalis TaxID=1125965 RepID=UPI00040C1342|nr:hypothetical protein [Brevundimonas abyssalis]